MEQPSGRTADFLYIGNFREENVQFPGPSALLQTEAGPAGAQTADSRSENLCSDIYTELRVSAWREKHGNVKS